MSEMNLAQENEKMIVEYTPLGGEPMKLSPSIVMTYLVPPDTNITVGEIAMFIALCKEQKLNPFLKEAYLIKYSDTKPASIVTGKEAFMKRAKASPDYVTHKAGVIVDHDGEIQYMPGGFKRKADELLGAWAEVITKSNPNNPVRIEVAFEEYFQSSKYGNGNWEKKPCTMIRKVALVQALREAFPNHLGAMYTSDELPIGDNDQPEKDITPVTPKLEANSKFLDMPEESESFPNGLDRINGNDGFIETPQKRLQFPIETGFREKEQPDEEEMQSIIAQEIAEANEAEESQEEMPDWMK